MIRLKNEYLGLGGMTWFFGVVEDRMDPLKLGRVRVRCFTWHTDDKSLVPTFTLPWATVVQPTTSAAVGDIGSSPSGLLPGTWVVGFFMDKQLAQMPVVIGSIPGVPQEPADPSRGFSDPDGVYPMRLDEPDSNRLARGDSLYPHSVLDAKRTDALNAPVGRGWSLPTGTYAAKYPYNHVMETEAGHILELDDTAGAERVHVYHKSGTYVEVGPKGDVAIRTVGSRYESTTGDAHSAVGGTVSVTVEGPVTVRSSSYVLVDSKDVRLGGSGGPAVARVGDSVKTPAGLGTIISGSSQVTAV